MLATSVEACIRGLGASLAAHRERWDDACNAPVDKEYRQYALVAPHLEPLYNRHGTSAVMWCAAYLVNEWCPSMGGICPTGHRLPGWWQRDVCPCTQDKQSTSPAPEAALTSSNSATCHCPTMRIRTHVCIHRHLHLQIHIDTHNKYTPAGASCNGVRNCSKQGVVPMLGQSSHMPCSLCAELQRRLGTPTMFRNTTFGSVTVPRPELFDLHPVGIFLAAQASRTMGPLVTLSDMWPMSEDVWLDLDILHAFVWHSISRRAALRRSTATAFKWLGGMCVDLLDRTSEQTRTTVAYNCGHAAGHANVASLNVSSNVLQMPLALARCHSNEVRTAFANAPGPVFRGIPPGARGVPTSVPEGFELALQVFLRGCYAGVIHGVMVSLPTHIVNLYTDGLTVYTDGLAGVRQVSGMEKACVSALARNAVMLPDLDLGCSLKCSQVMSNYIIGKYCHSIALGGQIAGRFKRIRAGQCS